MENLDQVRAQHAHGKAGMVDKAYVDRLPSMIVNNGLLAAAAFAATDNQKDKLGQVVAAVADYLKSRGLLRGENTAENLCRELSAQPSEVLRIATAEALAYLCFLKRFAKPKNKGR